MSETILYSIPAITFLLVAGLGIVLANVLIGRFGSRRRAITRRLNDITRQFASTGESILLKQDATVGESRLLKFLEAKLPAVANLKELIVRAGSSRTHLQIMSLCGLIAGFSFLILNLAGEGPMVAIFAALLSGCAPIVYLRIKEKKRRIECEGQLPEALYYMSRALRAGHGLSMAIKMVGEDMEAPIGPEFKKIFEEINFGLPFNKALSNLITRFDSRDVTFFVVAIIIQRETGGNLSDLLENLARTVRSRIVFRGKVRTLAAEGKISGQVLGLLPFFLAAILNLVNPKYMASLFSTPTGHNLIVMALLMLAIGFVWMWKITTIRV